MADIRPRFCAYCGEQEDRLGLCAKCADGLAKYPNENQIIFSAWGDRLLAQIEISRERHVEFKRYLLERGLIGHKEEL